MSVPFELVDEEEMQAIEIALQQANALRRTTTCVVTRCSFFGQGPRSLHIAKEIEETVAAPVVATLKFPLKRSLCVTDLTALEWCEKQVEFSFTRGKPKKTSVMQAGSARHLELEAEVVTRVDVDIQTREDSWAIRIINFLVGTRQLLTEGLTRELPIVAFVEGNWWTGIIDELQLPEVNAGPRLIDTKTRLRQALPSDAQKRNGRLQLMCYKLLWDTLCEQAIPSDEFFTTFALKSQRQLSESVRSLVADITLSTNQVECLEQLMNVFKEACTALPVADQSLKLRYEWQADRSLIGEEEFPYDGKWLKERLQWHLEFWYGNRQPELVPQEEAWKCNYCAFSQQCRAQNMPEGIASGL